jgi:starch synthase (maltosyl-transferring)
MVFALMMSRKRTVVVATLHSPYQYFDARSSRARFWAATARRTLRAVVSPSDHGTRFQRSCGIPARIAVTIRNAIDGDAFSSGDPSVPRAVLGLEDTTPIVLFSSRLDPQKRPVDAVHVFARAAPDPSPAVLVFVGSGEQEAIIIEEARRLGVDDRVRIVGYQFNVADWLAAATVWLFPTERENFSIALLEAMAAGCPILATVCPGNDEVLVDGSNALTYAVGDVSAAAERLRRLLDDDELRDRLSAGARATARSHSVEQMVREYRRAYGDAASAPV